MREGVATDRSGAVTLAPEVRRRLATHLSRVQIRRLLDDRPPREVTPLRGALLLMDIAGFTRLTLEMARDGREGAERQLGLMNVIFRSVIEATDTFGGDVQFFAGDAALVLFEPRGVSLEECVRRAAAAALRVRAILSSHHVAGQSVSVRLSVAAGECGAFEVGGEGGRWLPLIAGRALDSLFALDRKAEAADVLLSADAWELVSRGAQATPKPGGAMALSTIDVGVQDVDTFDLPPIPDTASERVAGYVPRIVYSSAVAGLREYVAEFRVISVVFVGLPWISPDDESQLEALHEAARTIQAQAHAYGGVVHEMMCDDKGTSVVAVFGAPPLAHDDDATRATQAAVAVHGALARALRARVGVATGPLFCGLYGNSSREHYGLVGPTINRAARLMQASERLGDVLVCNETARAARRHLDFEALDPIEVKGEAEPLEVHRAVSAQRRGAARPGEAHALVGRRDEVSALASRLEALANGRGGALLIEGEAGMGKTTLFARLLELARAHAVPVHAGYADPIEANTPYYPLRAALASVLGIDPDAAPDPSTYRATVEAAIAALDEEDRPLGPLIGAVLPVDLPQTELTAQMSGAIRAENLAHLLLALLREAARSGPFVLALEDLHWLDSASWALCRRAADELPNVLLVATLRPIELPPAELDPLTSGDGRAIVRLDAMDETELVELVKRRLGCDALPVALKRLIARRAEGNPFFAEELALALSESGAIVVEDGSCTVASSALDTASLPGTVQGVITSRVDRLAPQVQLTLKVASVVGRSFSDPMVAGIHPKGVDATEIREQLEPAERAGLVVREGLRGYAFRHALTHETTYGLMSGQQRAPLHLAAAEWLEARYSEDLAPYYGRLAHHLSEAEQSERALDYLGLAGQQALDAWANQAARDYFARAIAIDERLRGGLSVDLRRARWNERLAEAHYSLIEFDEARACCERAIRLSGFPKPKFGVTTPFEVMKHVMGRWTRPSAPATGELRERCVVALRAADLLQVVCLWEGDKLSLAHTVFEGTNIARRLGPAPESAFAKAMVGYLLMLSGLHDVAERDLLRGVEMADASGALLQRCSTHMYLGLSYSALGRLDEALAHLTEADEIAGRLGAGLWKHRGKYMRAEATMMSGRLEEAAELFRWCAIYASGAEPPIVGFAHAMQAICLLEAGGAVEDSLAIIEGPQGIQLVRDNPMVLQLYNCLACVIECCRETGDYARAVEAAEEALALAEQGDDCNMYMTGYNGHSAIAGLYLELWERALGGEAIEGAPPVAELRARLDRAIAQLTAGRKLFPAVRTRELLYLGAKHRLDGRARKAQRALREAAQLARSMQMPFEEAAACLELGRLATGDERATWLARADEVAEAAGLRRLSRRIEAARAAG